MAFYPIKSNDIFDIIMMLYELRHDCIDKHDDYSAGYYSACVDCEELLLKLISKYSQ